MRTQKELKETVRRLKSTLSDFEYMMYNAMPNSQVYLESDELRIKAASASIDSVIRFAEEIAENLDIRQLKHERNNK